MGFINKRNWGVNYLVISSVQNPGWLIVYIGDCYGDYTNQYLYYQWEFQDPKMEVLYHIRPYFMGIFPYIGH